METQEKKNIPDGGKDNNPLTDKKEPKKVFTMVPLLHWRTLVSIVIGLALGAVLGLIYWIISPSITSTDSTVPTINDPVQTGFLQSLQGEDIGPWETDVRFEVENTGSTPLDFRELENLGEYYSVKANSIPFFNYLSFKLNEISPEFNHTSIELGSMITTEFTLADMENDAPSFKMTVMAPTLDETVFLITNIPDIFLEYLVEEEINAHEQDYQDTLASIETITNAIFAAEAELDSLSIQEVDINLLNNPTYIAISSKITSLEDQLESQADELAVLIALGNVEGDGSSTEYHNQILEDVKTVKDAIVDAEARLNELEESTVDTIFINNPKYLELNAIITGLQFELDRMISGYDIMSTSGTTHVMGLSEMITRGITGPTYDELLNSVKETTNNIADCRKQLSLLEIQLAKESSELALDIQITQAEIDSLNEELDLLLGSLPRITGGSRSVAELQASYERTSTALAKARKELAILSVEGTTEAMDRIQFEFQMAQAKVDNLYTELSLQNDVLTSLIANEGVESDIERMLVVGIPDMPVPVTTIRLRDILIIGGLVGAIITWLVLNRKWVIQMITSSTHKSNEHEDEE